MVAVMVANMEVDIMADMVGNMVAVMMVDMVANIFQSKQPRHLPVLVCSCQKFAVLGCSFLHLGDLLIKGGPVPLDRLHVSQVAKIY